MSSLSSAGALIGDTVNQINNQSQTSPSQNPKRPDDLLQSRYVTAGLKPFSYLHYTINMYSLGPKNIIYIYIYMKGSPYKVA